TSEGLLPSTLKTLLRSSLMILYFGQLLIATFIFADEIRRNAFKLFTLAFRDSSLGTDRSKRLAYLGLALGAIPILSLSYGMVRNPYRYKIKRTTIPVKGLHPDLHGFKMVQFSDLHSGSFLMKEPVEH